MFSALTHYISHYHLCSVFFRREFCPFWDGPLVCAVHVGIGSSGVAIGTQAIATRLLHQQPHHSVVGPPWDYIVKSKWSVQICCLATILIYSTAGMRNKQQIQTFWVKYQFQLVQIPFSIKPLGRIPIWLADCRIGKVGSVGQSMCTTFQPDLIAVLGSGVGESAVVQSLTLTFGQLSRPIGSDRSIGSQVVGTVYVQLA